MDKQVGKVSNFSVASIIFLSSGMVIHVLVMPIILETAGRDSWISVLIAAPFFMIWLLMLFKFIHILNGKPFMIWVKEKWGAIGKFIVSFISIIFLLFNAIHTFADTMIWTISTYMQNTPFFAIGIIIIFVCILLAYNGLQSIAIVASLLFPVVTFLGFFVATVNEKHKDYSLLFPMLDQGYSPVLQGAIYAFIALGDCWIILLIAHEFKTKPSKKYQYGFLLFSILIFVGPLIAGITEFGPTEASEQRYTVYDQWKILSLGRLLQHVDFLSIFQWLSGALIRISISIYIAQSLITGKKSKHKNKVYIGLSLLFIIIMFLKWRSDVTLNLLKQYYFPIGVVVLPLFTLLILITHLISPQSGGKKKTKKQTRGEQNELNNEQSGNS